MNTVEGNINPSQVYLAPVLRTGETNGVGETALAILSTSTNPSGFSPNRNELSGYAIGVDNNDNGSIDEGEVQFFTSRFGAQEHLASLGIETNWSTIDQALAEQQAFSLDDEGPGQTVFTDEVTPRFKDFGGAVNLGALASNE